jgi:hypothetical protein
VFVKPESATITSTNDQHAYFTSFSIGGIDFK